MKKGGKSKHFPDAIIIGVKKCGTVTLEKFLSHHPNIASRGHTPFFEDTKLFKKGIQFYIDQMPESRPHQKVLVKSPKVFYQEDVMKVLIRHKEVLPNVKILLIVKNPIVRVVSDIVHFNDQFKDRNDFKKQDVNDVIMGRSKDMPYYPNLDITIREAVFLLSNYSLVWEQLTAVYPENQILVLDGDIFVKNPVDVLNKVEKFLDLPTFFTTDHFDYTGINGFPCFKLDQKSMSECMNKKKARKHPDLDQESLQLLRNEFLPIVKKFKNQSGMTLTLS